MARRTHRIIWTDPGIRDAESIVNYITAESPGNAARVIARIRKRVESLASMPSRGRPVPELVVAGYQRYRELIVKPYRIVYRMEPKTVWIMAVIDGRRDAEDLLLARLVNVD